jgi:hypothetical protein
VFECGEMTTNRRKDIEPEPGTGLS